ncbi:inorganic pyrophosphatase [Thermodesulfobacteriota bacterium]
MIEKYKFNKDFWNHLDQLVSESEIVIDRPKSSRHTKYPDYIYPVNYGFLKNTTSTDGAEIDIWVGEKGSNHVEGIMCIVDMDKRDSEIKILYSCTEKEMGAIYEIQNKDGMSGILIKR